MFLIIERSFVAVELLVSTKFSPEPLKVILAIDAKLVLLAGLPLL
jgi:hypothetical protein